MNSVARCITVREQNKTESAMVSYFMCFDLLLNDPSFQILLSFTTAGVMYSVLCGGRKTPPCTSNLVSISFWSLVITELSWMYL